MRTLEQDTVLVQLHGKVLGPFQINRLRSLAGFTAQALVSYPGSEKWAPAFRVLPNIRAYEPPVAFASVESVYPLQYETPSAPAAFDWKAGKMPATWVDRWFRRLAIFNIFLIAGLYAGWSYPSVRNPVLKELRLQFNEPVKWGPPPIRLVRYHAAPHRTPPKHFAVAQAKSVPFKTAKLRKSPPHRA